MNTRIAPHGNEDDIKDVLSTDCAMCPPNGVRIFQSVAALLGWNVTDADAETAFLITGKAERDVWVKPKPKNKT